MDYIDSHTHLQFAAYDEDREDLIQEMAQQNLRAINVGTQKESSLSAVELANKHPHLFATIGLHPTHTAPSFHDAQESSEESAAQGEIFDTDFYRKLGQDPNVVAFGECGLDYFRLNDNAEDEKKLQKTVFLQHIALAKELQKPLMCHIRPAKGSQDAYEDAIAILREHTKQLPGFIMHFYAGDAAITNELLEMGAHFTFGGVITFTRDYDAIIDMIPLERILLETDAPYVTPAPYRGKRNEPLYVKEVYKKMSELKNLPLKEIVATVYETNARIFGI